ncbi:MAG: CHAT domain-containing protein [Saprospiraceae bacterium]|nr:CHAT domain-containing protein [Candidatus Vicinibacter affinis]
MVKSTQSNLATLNYSNGNYKKSELQFIEAKNIFEKSLGNKHPAYVENLKNLALLYEKQNEFSRAELLFAEIFQLDQSRLVLATSFLSEFELAKYSNTFKSSEAYIGSFILNRWRVNRLVQFEKLNRLAFDHVLFNKGFLLEAGIKLNNISLTSPESVEIHHRLKTYVRRLGIEYAKPIIERKGVSELEEKLNKAEKEFARIVKGYSGAIKVLHWENVREKLSSGEASIEFVHFGINFPKQTDSIMYVALILLPNDTTPYFVSLFEEHELNQLLSTTSSRRMDYVTDLYIAPSGRGTFPLHGNNKTLYDLIWKPLEPHLLGVHKIYFSPSGLLHRINQNAISVDDQKLLSDKYELIQLGSTRQLVINESKKNSKPLDASIFGGINFEMDTTSLNANNFKIKNEGIASRSENGFFYTDSTLRGNTWTYLKGSEHEVSEINNIVYKAGIKSNLYKGNAATEEAFKKLGNFKSESPQIIHLSTHGYFFPDAKLTRQPEGGKMDGEIVFKMSEHPMLRSGLIMAGGNHAWKTGKPVYPDAEDGILTAYEISQLDLKIQSWWCSLHARPGLRHTG